MTHPDRPSYPPAMRRLAPLALLLSLVACGGGEDPAAEPSEPAEPETFTASGVFVLTDASSVDYDYETETDCYGIDGYDDIAEGTQVTVRDAEGSRVGSGELGEGRLDTFSDTAACTFRFMVYDIPVSEGIYTVEVASRGEINFRQAEAGGLELSLG